MMPRPATWRQIRASVLARDNYACDRCGAPTQDVDRALPLDLGGSPDAGNLRAICTNCGDAHTCTKPTHNTKGN